MNRRAFLTALAAGWMVKGDPTLMPGGEVIGPSQIEGHRLRDGRLPEAQGPAEEADIVIVGSGASGLSAAWRLAGAGLSALVLELEPFVGGTSTWGEEGAGLHPWGAHYLPAPNPDARAALRLLSEMGVMTGWDAANRPIFDERTLCHAPEERLFYRGSWFSGLVPEGALGADEREELGRFSALIHDLAQRVGADGRPVFRIPIALSSRDPSLLGLDAMSAAEYLAREGFRSRFLRWYVRYACLDDFGGEPEDVSAWAALHYFASRKRGSEELEGSRFLVWPEGNGRLIKELLARSSAQVRTRALVSGVMPNGHGGAELHWVDLATGQARRLSARGVILATPAFLTRRLLRGAGPALPERKASPWLVANLHVEGQTDPDLPWDNVLFEADGLGYVDARHQLMDRSERTVLTYYRAYGGADARRTRAGLMGARWEDLAEGVLRDLYPAHPDLRARTARIDVMLWGHAMPRPTVGFLGSRPFEVPCLVAERVAWAHVDQSGIALFEEAQARGVRAAEELGKAMGLSLGESWL